MTTVQAPITTLDQPLKVSTIYQGYLEGDVTHDTIDRHVSLVAKAMPDIFDLCRENRAFLSYAIRLFSRKGITQFIDIGSGYLLSKNNTHEIAQAIDSDAKVAYIDLDPMVAEQARALLTGNDFAQVFCGDIRVPDAVLGDAKLNGFIDFNKPVGVLMMCVACFFNDKEIPDIMQAIRGKIPAGSYVAVTHDTLDGRPWDRNAANAVKQVYEKMDLPLYFRTQAEVRWMMDGLEMVGPGVVTLEQWFPEDYLDCNREPLRATGWLLGAIGWRRELSVAFPVPLLST